MNDREGPFVERAMTRALVAACLPAACLLAAGCGTPKYVTIDGKRVERPSVAYSSDFFWLEHDRAFPRVFDPHRGLDVDDGTLHGRMCNVEVSFDASWYRARLHLDGRGAEAGLGTRTYGRTSDFALAFDVAEPAPGRRHITGKVPDNPFIPVNTSLDLEVSPERLVGRIGTRWFDLHANGEYFVGHYERHGDVAKPFDVTYAIYGRQILASMVPADQALTLLMMMTCSTTIDYDGKTVRGFSMVASPP